MAQTKSQSKSKSKESSWVDADALLAELDADPQIKDAAQREREFMRESDRAHAMSLAMIREAAHLTQDDIAKQLGISQVAVSKTERRPDLLWSTLNSYLGAVGARAVIMVELKDGTVVQVSLDQAAADKR